MTAFSLAFSKMDGFLYPTLQTEVKTQLTALELPLKQQYASCLSRSGRISILIILQFGVTA